MILKGVSVPELPSETVEKLKKLHMLDYGSLLQRNLSVLMAKMENRDRGSSSPGFVPSQTGLK